MGNLNLDLGTTVTLSNHVTCKLINLSDPLYPQAENTDSNTHVREVFKTVSDILMQGNKIANIGNMMGLRFQMFRRDIVWNYA